MKKQTLARFSKLLMAAVLISCSGQDTIKQDDTASRNIIEPIQNATVRIGTQIWMVKNLNVSLYRNGDSIPQVTDPSQWATLTTGAWCYYENSTTNGVVYGKLYNWYAVNDSRGLAPQGWHVASNMEWSVMTDFLTSVAVGGKLKATSYWFTPNTGATNSSRFTALPGGQRNFDGAFYNSVTSMGVWWTNTESTTAYAWFRMLQYNTATIYRGNNGYKNSGFSIRCVQD